MKSVRVTYISLFWLISLTVSLPFYACSGGGNKPLPASGGRVGEVVVVAEKPLWNSEVGAAIRELFTRDYPFLPQSEPSFNLINVTNDNFSGTFSIHRNIVLVDIDTKYTKAAIVSQTDVWASPQLVIKVTGHDIASVANLLLQKEDYLWGLFEQAEIDRQTTNAHKYEDAKLRQLVEKQFGLSLYIPDGYRQKTAKPDAQDFLWFGYDTNFATIDIFVYAYPYTDSAQLSAKQLIAKRDEFLKKNVPLSREGSYMLTNPYTEPEYTVLAVSEVTVRRLRGLWEVHNGFMGGPFISCSRVVGNKVVTVEGCVYAPKTEKRNCTRQAAGIVLTTIPDKTLEVVSQKEN